MNFSSSKQKLQLAKANSAAAEKEKREKAARLQAAAKKREEDKEAVQRTSQLAMDTIDQKYEAVQGEFARAEVMAERHGKQVKFWEKEVKKGELTLFAPFNMEVGSDQKNAAAATVGSTPTRSIEMSGVKTPKTPVNGGTVGMGAISKCASPDSFYDSPTPPSVDRMTPKRTQKTPVSHVSAASKEQTPTSRIEDAKAPAKVATPKGGPDESGGRGGSKTSKITRVVDGPPPNSVGATLARLKKEKE